MSSVSRAIVISVVMFVVAGCATREVHMEQALPEPSMTTADEAYRAQQWGRVDRLYRYLLEKDPDNALYLARLGVAASRVGNLDAARQYLQRAIVVDEHMAEAGYNLALVYLNLAHQQLVEVEEGAGDPARRVRAQRMRTVLERLAALP